MKELTVLLTLLVFVVWLFFAWVTYQIKHMIRLGFAELNRDLKNIKIRQAFSRNRERKIKKAVK